jgi:prepilin-type N-terminal cleavage/methylation domain-containing protein
MHSTRTPSRRRGFSLTELAVTMTLIAVLAALAIPRFARSLNEQRAMAAARRIAADVTAAQSRAKATSASQTISFTPSARTYQIQGVSDPDRPSASYVIDLSAAPYAVTSLTASLGGDTDLIFSGYGIADSNGTITLQVGDAQKQLTIDKDTGSVTIQ